MERNQWYHKCLSMPFFPSLILESCNSGFSVLTGFCQWPQTPSIGQWFIQRWRNQSRVYLPEIILRKLPSATGKFKNASKLCSTSITTSISVISQEQFNIPLFPVPVVHLNRLPTPWVICSTFALKQCSKQTLEHLQEFLMVLQNIIFNL